MRRIRVLIGATVFGFSAVARAAPEAPAYAGSETCAACHAAEHEEWRTSRHAGALSPTFTAYWREAGSSPDCLSCHTTGFDPARRTYAEAGVACETCHGPLRPDHPGSASMTLPTDSSACMACHRQTYREWQVSGHAQHDIRCFDCHAVHRQGLRQPAVEQQCGACHARRLEDFAHATHHLQGLTCATCHMPRPPTGGFGGTGAPAHNFFVGAQTCAACHEEMVHTSGRIPALAGQVEQLTQQADVRYAEQLQETVHRLEWSLDRQRSRLPRRLWMAFAAGLALGLLTSWWRRRPPAA